jgi:hypothetical protein
MLPSESLPKLCFPGRRLDCPCSGGNGVEEVGTWLSEVPKLAVRSAAPVPSVCRRHGGSSVGGVSWCVGDLDLAVFLCSRFILHDGRRADPSTAAVGRGSMLGRTEIADAGNVGKLRMGLCEATTVTDVGSIRDGVDAVDSRPTNLPPFRCFAFFLPLLDLVLFSSPSWMSVGSWSASF